jgi:hypothetical protein
MMPALPRTIAATSSANGEFQFQSEILSHAVVRMDLTSCTFFDQNTPHDRERVVTDKFMRDIAADNPMWRSSFLWTDVLVAHSL